jgi:transposase
MDRYVGLDVHAKSCTAAVIDARGKKLGSHVLETNGKVLVEFFRLQAGKIHVCLEEGTQAGWVLEILSPHVERVVVVHVSESRGQKSDELDAFALAERLRTDAGLVSVYKRVGSYAKLRELVRTHRMIVEDEARVQNRIKALYRSRGVQVVGKTVYSERSREQTLKQLPTSSRCAAELLLEQYDAVHHTRNRAHKELVAEARKHPPTSLLETIPGVGEIRAAEIVSVVVTPERFRTRQQFWAYCGLGIVMRSSSDWVRGGNGQWTRAPMQQTRGLNRNHNHVLKNAFKGAATSVIQIRSESALRKDYERLLAAGTKPNLAKLTVARKIAAITLAIWKKKEEYDPTKTAKPS